MRQATIRFALIVALLGTLIASIAVSNDSLWIDEAHTVEKAAKPTLGAWWQVMSTEDGSDAQMPVYMLFAWVWGRVAGTNPEALLRASNLVWFALGICVVCLALRPWPRWMVASATTLALHPFVWFYINEARPYIMQLTGMLLVTCFFIHRLRKHAASWGWNAALAGGLFLLCGSSMLGALWAAPTLLLLWLWRKDLALTKHDWGWICGAVFLLIGLGAYYVHTLLQNAKPTPGDTGLLNLAFAFYELLGCTGLGPARDEIRTQGVSAIQPHLPFILAIGLFSSGVLLAGMVSLRKNEPRRFWFPLVLCAAPIAMLFVLSALSHSRLLGRHLMPAVPSLIFLAGAGLSFLVTPKSERHSTPFRAIGPLFAIGFLLLVGYSSLLLRFHPRHKKDDYCTAAALAAFALAQGQNVWWSADANAGQYYGIRISSKLVPDQAWLAYSPEAATLEPALPPQLIVTSRPDVYDRNGAVTAYIHRKEFQAVRQLKGFTLWVPRQNLREWALRLQSGSTSHYLQTIAPRHVSRSSVSST